MRVITDVKAERAEYDVNVDKNVPGTDHPPCSLDINADLWVA